MQNKFSLTLCSAVIALAVSGCANTSTTPPSQQLDTLLTNYTQDMQNLDKSEFGIINDQMAAARQTLDRSYLDQLKQVDRSKLTDEEKVYFDTFRFDREVAIRGASFANARFGNPDVPVTHFYNYMQWHAEEAGAAVEATNEGEDQATYQQQLEKVNDYTSWVRNLHSQYHLGELQHIQLPKVLVNRFYQNSLDTIATDDYAILKVGLKDLKSHAEYSPKFVAEYDAAVTQAIKVTKEFLSYVRSDYANSSRGEGSLNDKHIGWGDLPNGQAWYQWHLDRNSTTGKSAQELHQMGEKLVADAKAEMIRVAKTVVEKRGDEVKALFRDPSSKKVAMRTFKLVDANGEINLPEFFAYLNSEQFFFGRDGRNVSGTEHAEVCKQASNQSACESSLLDYYSFKVNANDVVASYFKTIQTDYAIEPTPAGGELYDGVGSYDENVFTLNTNPDYSLQKWNVSTLLLHEAAPGHHFQHAYSKEYPPANIPAYMDDIWYTAYGEGWALYTEWLGIEMGIYGELNQQGQPTFINGKGMCLADLDYSQFQGGIYTDEEECNALQYFGSLNEAQLRNMRLAVDTGIHAKGWSIQQARDYMRANSALGDGDIESESYRYAAHVGQAVSYKSGFLVIKEMLDKAQTELGDKFDYAEFHHQLLSYGQQPMEVVEENVNNWIASKK
ncbi:DUF885 domain-containing protein [Vibrio intestinalis]|uniref:DUF885 domain-containing protein n=1 Tax=Vibrio intestinalis TaxID=2933291 RepID=UPI0021A935D2|nr:DUF885 domain-containing protein [Vibrio intestinalis]